MRKTLNYSSGNGGANRDFCSGMLTFCVVVSDYTENCICKEERQRCSILYHKQKWCCWLYWYLKVGRLHPRLEKQRIVWKMGYKYETAWFLLIAAYSSVNLSFLSLLIKALLVLWRNCESFQPEVHPRTELSSSVLKHRPLSWGEWMFSDDKAYLLN